MTLDTPFQRWGQILALPGQKEISLAEILHIEPIQHGL